MTSKIDIVSHQEIAESVEGGVNPILTIVAVRDVGTGAFRYRVSDMGSGPHNRVLTTIEYLEHLHAASLHDGAWSRHADRFVFQTEDIPVDAISASWESRVGWRKVRLVPDIYYFSARGYEDFQPELPAWNDRLPVFVWRGSTTGRFGQTLSDLDELPRYRLCRLADSLGAVADIGLTDVVQSAHPHEERVIRERLSAEGLLKPFMPMSVMGGQQFIVDIDGNSNSWNFMMKLRLGCCVLRVASPWRQWFSDRLIAWEHFVPIASDLSDFAEKAEWCLSHPAECREIAAAGHRFAYDMKFSDEMLKAARSVHRSDDQLVGV